MLTTVSTTLIIATLATAITRHDFRYISYKDLHTSVHLFSPEGVTAYSQMLFDVSRNQVFVGARDVLYRLSLSSLDLLEAAHWKSPSDKILSCIFKGQTEENCHNYIKILLSNEEKIFACGTNAFSPQCSWREIDNISNITKIVDGIAKCPYNPSASVTGFISEYSEYYFGGPTDFSSSDSLISKITDGQPTLRTKQYNSFWLNDPQFVGSFETAKFAYFLFRETAVEYINCGKIVYSRIARVCKNDQGGHTMLKDNWTTFIKARLNCSINGDYPFYYNEIQSISYIPQENIVYATFTTPSNSIPGSAVCAFNMTAIDDAFSGPFKYQPDMGSAWTRHDIPHRDHLDCKASRHNNLLETARYQLMDNAVQASTLNPLHVADLERFSHITVDVVSTKLHNSVHVIYIATLEGFIKKLTVLPKTKETCIVEVWQVESVIRNMQFLKETNSVYVTTDNGLMRIPADHCKRHSSKQSCLNSMDPYCGWNEIEEKCTTAPEGEPHYKFWKQRANACPVLDSPINGGYSSWSEWSTCYHRITPDMDSIDQCLCQTRQCNNPAPANDGLTCEGPSVAVRNCTVHGGWSDWSAWSACSATCGTAVKTRSRTCTNPAPAFGGRVCVGQDRTEAFCSEIPPCPAQPVDGGWNSWSSWSSCTANCGGGYKIRQRKCDNPPPKSGGQYCRGNDIEHEKCNEHLCNEQKKIHQTEWITDYNITYNGYHQKRFKITCKAPTRHAHQIKISVKEEGQNCLSNKQCESDENENHSGWSSWTNWSECSATCGGGTQFRTRYCLRGRSCSGSSTQTRDCNKHTCEDNWGCWSEWSPCNVSCGWGVKTRYRSCLGQNCKGSIQEEQPCQDQSCEDILGWGNWTQWSLCDESNEQHRKRICYTQSPGPQMCQGNSVQTRMCVGNSLTNEISAMGMQIEDCSCTSTALPFFFLGSIVGLLPGIGWLLFHTIRKKKNRVPSSPHYITKENPYIQVPTREKPPKKYAGMSSIYSGHGTLKSTLKFDTDSIPTLKRQTSEMKNGHPKQHCDSDKYLYD